jgi:CRISPR-associated endonuclease Cas1/CRISPR-associated protein Cas4
MDAPLWPARNVAEFAYCPRLFYYMEVEGIHVASHDTEEGQRIHRRVDAPSNRQQPDDAEPAAPRKVRSLTLTSAELALTATLDLAEISGNIAVPVEYRKGRPRRVREDINGDENELGQAVRNDVEPWPTDRIHVGLQVLLLEHAGYEVPRAVLYYAAERRRVDVVVDDTLRQEALATLAAAKACAAGTRPLPLVNDPRCPRCSLQPICLPDEINAQREAATASPRKLWPPRDDGIHLVVQQNGTRVGVRGSALHITEADGTKVDDIPLANVESFSLLGPVQVSTQALHTLADRAIPVAFLSAAGRLVAMVDPLDSVSAETRRNQVRKFDDPAACLALSRALVAAKIRNQRTLLMRNYEQSSRHTPCAATEPDDDGTRSVPATLPRLVADLLAHEAAAAENAGSIASVRGHEGQAGALYFAHFAGMLKGEMAGEFDQHGRQRRPPPDPVNSCLSLAYTMLTHECVAALRTARLEPSIGAFHVSRPGRPALALDLLEPFRPLIADSMTISAFNRGELREGHFQRTAAGCLFTEPGRKAFFNMFGRRMSDEVTHPAFGYKLSYRRMLILHARMIAAWINGEIPTLAFLTTR